MYGSYGTTAGAAWWAHHAVGLLLPHSLVPSRIAPQQCLDGANCSSICAEPLSPARATSPRKFSPEKAKCGESRPDYLTAPNRWPLRAINFECVVLCPKESIHLALSSVDHNSQASNHLGAKRTHLNATMTTPSVSRLISYLSRLLDHLSMLYPLISSTKFSNCRFDPEKISFILNSISIFTAFFPWQVLWFETRSTSMQN